MSGFIKRSGLRIPLSVLIGLGLVAATLALLGSWTSRPPVVRAQGPDGYSTYYVAPDCTGLSVTPCYTSVQAAVDAVDDPNDLIKVAAGTYSGVQGRPAPGGYPNPPGSGLITQVVYISKSLTLRGGYTTTDWTTSNPISYPTTLDAQGQGRVLVVVGAVTPTIEGLRLTGGDATGLGGSGPSYDGAGGGVYVVTATVTISSCTIYSNVAGRNGLASGGGVYLLRSTGTLVRNTILSNTAGMSTTVGPSGQGGGIFIAEGDATLIGNVVRNNTASRAGYGVGGGIYVDSAAPLLEGNIVRENAASTVDQGLGGGLMLGLDSNARLVNTVLVSNVSGPTADSGGAALALDLGASYLTHTTLFHNYGGDGSGVYILEGVITMTNAIVVSHTVGITVPMNGSAVVRGVLWYNNGLNIGGEGAISVTYAYTGSPALAADGYHLLTGSAAIDRGLDAGVTTDVDGDPRPMGLGYDLGADERICRPMTGVIVTGPTAGLGGTAYTFTATVSPPTATLPMTYTWQATGQPPVVHGGAGLSDAVAFTWNVSGTQRVTVTVQSCGGTVSDTHAITIVIPGPTEVAIAGPTTGLGGTAYTFTATTAPPTATLVLPITYTWQATGQPPVVHGGAGLSDTVTFTWQVGGIQWITVTAQNQGGTASDTHAITIVVRPPTGVTIVGPTAGLSGTAYTFTATVSPPTATLPITYTWQATGQPPVVHGGAGLSDTVTFTWQVSGTQQITVTARNWGGTVSDTHLITLQAPPPPCYALTDVAVTGPAIGISGTAHTFAATVSPPTATLPITYTWQATGQSSVVHGGAGLSDAVAFTWNVTGTQQITVTARNCGGAVSRVRSITIIHEHRTYLPLVLRW